MIDRAHYRGLAVSLTETLPAAPEVMHYTQGEVTYHPFKRGGVWWVAVYKAKHDGIGWLVVEATCRPLVLLADDGVHIRAKVVQDLGDEVQLAYRSRGMQRFLTIDRSEVVYLCEAVEVPMEPLTRETPAGR